MQSRFDAKVSALTASCAEGCRVLLGVSGGIDSMTMAHLFLHSCLKMPFAVAHMDFSLRGEESDGDRSFVEEWCSATGVRCFTKKVDAAEYSRSRGISVEMAARELRYSWFEDLRKEEGFDYVAVAHNLNDSVETMYLNLLRGTGLRGLAGIRAANGHIIRPMLEFSREEIERFAAAQGIEYRTDSTNLQSSFARNRLRNEVFPHFRKINAAFLRTAEQEMNRFARAEEILSEVYSSKEGRLYRQENGALHIDIALLKREKYCDYWLFRLLDGYGFNSSQIAQIEDCLDTQTGKRFLTSTHVALFDRGFIKVYPISGEAQASVSWTIFARPEGFDPKVSPSGVLHLDADKVEMPISTRPPKDGDRFIPFGMRGSKLLNDFFADIKLDVEQKKHQTLVVSASGDILCVAGLRIDDRFKVTARTENILEITLSKE